MAVRIPPREDQRQEAEYVEQRILADPDGFFSDERTRVRAVIEEEMARQAAD